MAANIPNDVQMQCSKQVWGGEREKEKVLGDTFERLVKVGHKGGPGGLDYRVGRAGNRVAEMPRLKLRALRNGTTTRCTSRVWRSVAAVHVFDDRWYRIFESSMNKVVGHFLFLTSFPQHGEQRRVPVSASPKLGPQVLFLHRAFLFRFQRPASPSPQVPKSESTTRYLATKKNWLAFPRPLPAARPSLAPGPLGPWGLLLGSAQPRYTTIPYSASGCTSHQTCQFCTSSTRMVDKVGWSSDLPHHVLIVELFLTPQVPS